MELFLSQLFLVCQGCLLGPGRTRVPISAGNLSQWCFFGMRAGERWGVDPCDPGSG